MARCFRSLASQTAFSSFILGRRRRKSSLARETNVFACTLLHRELRDYSLGQIAFAVFQVLFAITQLLCHVRALLTSACNDVFACTLLHRELRDYSLGQIAFAVF